MGDDISIARNSSQTSPRRQVRHATQLFVHPEYSIETLQNDIAVIRVSQSIHQLIENFIIVKKLQLQQNIVMKCIFFFYSRLSRLSSKLPHWLRLNCRTVHRPQMGHVSLVRTTNRDQIYPFLIFDEQKIFLLIASCFIAFKIIIIPFLYVRVKWSHTQNVQYVRNPSNSIAK